MTRWMETREVLQAVRRQAIFYRFSGGGVTFSGGGGHGPGEFFQELTQRLYDEGYDLALETCGVFDFDRMAPALGKMNQILWT